MSARFHIAPADPDVRAPHWQPAPGGWDTHAHVFGPAAQFPVQPDAAYDAPDQIAQDYLHLLDALGLAHGVLVQPSVYGHDNRAMMAALAAAPGRLFAVVDLDPLAVPDAELDALRRAGAIGLRVRPSGIAPDRFARIADRVAELGWHLDIYIESIGRLATLAPQLAGLKVPYIVEAMGEPKAGQPVTDADFQTLLALVRDGAWVKLSHSYHIDPAGPPYAGAAPFARALLAAAPGRCVWGSDWPHPMKDGPMPNDGLLLDLLRDWCDGDLALANRVLGHNPSAFYPTPRKDHR